MVQGMPVSCKYPLDTYTATPSRGADKGQAASTCKLQNCQEDSNGHSCCLVYRRLRASRDHGQFAAQCSRMRAYFRPATFDSVELLQHCAPNAAVFAEPS